MTSSVKANKKPRCAVCNKKIPLVMQGSPCKCGLEFCSLHRLPEKHECSFNYREKHLSNVSEKIEAMKCVADKVEKI